MQIKGSPVLWFLKRIYFYFIYVYVLVRATWCRCLYRPEEVRVWNSLQLELQSVVSCSKWMLGTKSRFSGTALKHWAISPPHGLLFLGTRPEDFASISCENIEVVVGLFKIYSVWSWRNDCGIWPVWYFPPLLCLSMDAMLYEKALFLNCGNRNGTELEFSATPSVDPGHCALSGLLFPAVPVTHSVFILPFAQWEQQWGISLDSSLVLMDTHKLFFIKRQEARQGEKSNIFFLNLEMGAPM